MDYKALIVVIAAVALAGAGGFLMGRNPNPQAGGFYTNGFASSTLTTIPVTLATGGTNATSQTTNGVCYDNGTSITCSTGITYTATGFGIATTSPKMALDVASGTMRAFSVSTTTCTALNDGAVFYNSKDQHLYVCEATVWQIIK